MPLDVEAVEIETVISTALGMGDEYLLADDLKALFPLLEKISASLNKIHEI